MNVQQADDIIVCASRRMGATLFVDMRIDRGIGAWAVDPRGVVA